MSMTFVLIHGIWHGGWAVQEVMHHRSVKGHRAHVRCLAAKKKMSEGKFMVDFAVVPERTMIVNVDMQNWLIDGSPFSDRTD